MISLIVDIIQFFLGTYLLAVLCALVFNKSLRKQGYDGIPNIDCFNPKKLFSFIIGFIFYYLDPLYLIEQLVLRFYSECSDECFNTENEQCPNENCGCNIKMKAWSPFETCGHKNKRWGKIIFSRKKYKELRLNYPVKISIDYEKE